MLDLSGPSFVCTGQTEGAELHMAGGTLQVGGKLFEQDDARLRRWTRKLLRAEAEVVVIDMSGIERICSRGVGTWAAVLVDLRSEGRGLRLIASPEAEKVLQLAGVASVLLPPADSKGKNGEE